MCENVEDGSVDGCIFWTDENGIRWCKDVYNFYGGGAGSLWYVSMEASTESPAFNGDSSDDVYVDGGEVWSYYHANSAVFEDGARSFSFTARGGGGYRHGDGLRQSFDGADHAIYWCDEAGMLWCRDRYGVYGGGQGAEYYSVDGGGVWYGDGEEWVEFSEDALEFIRCTTARKLRGKTTRRDAHMRRAGWSSSSTLRLQSSCRGGIASGAQNDGGDGKADGGRLAEDDEPWENQRSVLRKAGGAGGTGEQGAKKADYADMYGGGEGAAQIASVKAEEARVNAAFDRSLRSAPAPFWPELPLRL